VSERGITCANCGRGVVGSGVKALDPDSCEVVLVCDGQCRLELEGDA